MIRVMIAEDEAAIRRGLIHCIRWDELGLELAAEAENGRQALDFLIASPVDILITDMRMPECDGRQLLHEIEERALNCEILVLSEYTDFSYMQQAIHAHVFDYLLKPVDPEHLNALLAQVKEKIQRRSNSGDALSALLGAATLTGGRADAALGAYLSSHRDSAFLLGEVLSRKAAPAAEFWKSAPFESRFLPLPQERRFAVLSLLPGESGMREAHRWRTWFLSRLEAMDGVSRAGVSGGSSLAGLSRAHTEAAAALDYVHRSQPVLAYTDIRELGQPALSLPFHDRQLTEIEFIEAGREEHEREVGDVQHGGHGGKHADIGDGVRGVQPVALAHHEPLGEVGGQNERRRHSEAHEHKGEIFFQACEKVCHSVLLSLQGK